MRPYTHGRWTFRQRHGPSARRRTTPRPWRTKRFGGTVRQVLFDRPVSLAAHDFYPSGLQNIRFVSEYVDGLRDDTNWV